LAGRIGAELFLPCRQWIKLEQLWLFDAFMFFFGGRQMRTKLLVILSAIIIIMSLVLSACGGSSASSSTGPLTVGELFPMTGREPYVGSWFLHGAKTAIADVNKNGGVMGHQLNPVLADTGGDAVDAVAAWKQLRLSNPTFEIGPSSLEVESVIQSYDPVHLVDFVEGGTTQIDHMQYKYVFRTTPSDSTLAVGMAYYAIHKGYTRAATFFESTANAQTLVQPLVDAYTKHGGTLTTNMLVTPHQSSYRSEVEKLFASNPQAIFMQTDPQTASTFFSDVRQLGHMNVPFIQTDGGADASMAKAMGLQDASKWLTGMSGTPPQGEAWTHFKSIYQQVWGDPNPVQLSQNTYDGVIIACLAMTAANSTDPTVWVNYIPQVANPPGVQVYTYAEGVAALKAGKKINYEGASGHDDFNQYHNVAGSWDVVQFDPTGTTTKTLLSITEEQVAAYQR
jgi:ABC-type branched-subunit amino acid transport system substrate-binding protein